MLHHIKTGFVFISMCAVWATAAAAEQIPKQESEQNGALNVPIIEKAAEQPAALQRLKIFGYTIEPPMRVKGKDLPWDHEIQIALPPSYAESDKTYPVLWVTDGAWWFESAIYAAALAGQHIPEMIIVAVGTPPEAADKKVTRRVYEFYETEKLTADNAPGGDVLEAAKTQSRNDTAKLGQKGSRRGGGAENFLSFLVEDLRPALTKDYRLSDVDVLFGHSAGGRFCTYALLTRPEAFDKYICASPSLYSGDMAMFETEKRFSDTHDDLNADVFFGVGEAEVKQDLIGAIGIVSSTVRMVEILNARDYPSLNMTLRIFPGDDHTSVVPVSLYWGLRTIWSDE